MASKKATIRRISKVSIEVVKNGYSLKVGGGSKSDDEYSCTMYFTSTGLVAGSSGSLSGDFVFNDFSQLSSFLRKHLSVPTEG